MQAQTHTKTAKGSVRPPKPPKSIRNADEIITHAGVMLYEPAKEEDKANLVVVNNLRTDNPPKPYILSVLTCVEILTKAGLDRRAALVNELAVGLGIFYEAGGATRDAKELLTAVYARSGYDCGTSSGADYKTVNRRVNATAALFETIGYEKIAEKVGHEVEGNLVGSLVEALKPLQLYSIDHVLAYSGKPRANGTPQTRASGGGSDNSEQGGEDKGNSNDEGTQNEGETSGKAEEKLAVPPMRFHQGRIRIEVPGDVAAKELMELGLRLIKKARSLEAKEGKEEAVMQA